MNIPKVRAFKACAKRISDSKTLSDAKSQRSNNRKTLENPKLYDSCRFREIYNVCCVITRKRNACRYSTRRVCNIGAIIFATPLKRQGSQDEGGGGDGSYGRFIFLTKSYSNSNICARRNCTNGRGYYARPMNAR